MANNAKPDDQGLPDKSAHPGLNWNASCTKPGVGDDEWNLEPSTSMVPPKDWADRLYSDISDVTMVSRVRTVDVTRLSGVEFLQLNRDGIFRLSNIWNSRDANLRGLRQCNSLLQPLFRGILHR